jgi:DNA-binding transcriptional ArsR family regulator
MQAKISSFNSDLQDIAHYAKLLSHPARVAIIKLLAEKKTCISGDIALELPLSRTTVSQHLQELKNAGLIKGEVSGLNVNYCLDFQKWKSLQADFQAFFAFIHENFEQKIDCNC